MPALLDTDNDAARIRGDATSLPWADDNAAPSRRPRPHPSATKRSRPPRAGLRDRSADPRRKHQRTAAPGADTSPGEAGRGGAANLGGPAILAAVGAPATDAVIGEAARIAQELGGTLHFVAAYRPASASERERTRRQLPAGLRLDYDDDRLIEARDALEDARETAAVGVPVHLHLERGDLVAGLCRVARREEALLIVAAGPAGRTSGCAEARLVNLAPCRVRLIEVGARRRGDWRSGKRLGSRRRDRRVAAR